MARRILVVPVTPGAGVTAACLGLAHALDSRHVAVGFAKPFASSTGLATDASTALFRLATPLRPPEPLSLDDFDAGVLGGRVTGIMTEVVKLVADLDTTCQILILEGVSAAQHVQAHRVNAGIAQGLDAEVLLVGSVGELTPERFAGQALAAQQSFRTRADSRVIGVLLNRLPGAADPAPYVAALADRGLACAGVVTEHPEFAQPRLGDVVSALDLQVLTGTDLSRRVSDTVIAAMAMPGFIPYLRDGVLVVTPGDRHDVLMAAALAEASGTRLAGLLLTAGIAPQQDVLGLVTRALGDLPVLLGSGGTFATATEIVGLDPDIPMDDQDRARRVMTAVADGYAEEFLANLPQPGRAHRATGPQVEQRLRDLMSRGHLRIALTDGADPRVLTAVNHMQRFAAVQFTLIADPAAVAATLESIGETLPLGAQVRDPAETGTPIAELAEQIRGDQAESEVVFDAGHPLPYGLAMLRAGEVDGLIGGLHEDRTVFLTAVAGAVPLTSGAHVLSSSRVTMLAEEVVLIADTMLNQHPDARQLASIASCTATTAQLCGIEPYVGFVAPSSLSPLHAEQRSAIAQARDILAERQPDLPTEGPATLQELTGRPRSEPQPTVLVFPDVASATASAKAIGQAGRARLHPPVLQGLSAPVNILPANADVEAILDVMVATAGQAAQRG